MFVHPITNCILFLAFPQVISDGTCPLALYYGIFSDGLCKEGFENSAQYSPHLPGWWTQKRNVQMGAIILSLTVIVSIPHPMAFCRPCWPSFHHGNTQHRMGRLNSTLGNNFSTFSIKCSRTLTPTPKSFLRPLIVLSALIELFNAQKVSNSSQTAHIGDTKCAQIRQKKPVFPVIFRYVPNSLDHSTF